MAALSQRPLERLESLAPRVPAMNLRPIRPRGDREMALAEVMGDAMLVRNFLKRAAGRIASFSSWVRSELAARERKAPSLSS